MAATISDMKELSKTPSIASTLSLPPKEACATVSDDLEAASDGSTDWKPQKQEYLVMATLATISLMVALDATILVSILPVRFLSGSITFALLTSGTDTGKRPSRHKC